MHRAARGLALAFLLWSASPAKADVDEYIGRTVVSVRMEAEGTAFSDETIQPLLETPVGRALSMRDVRDSVLHLIALGRFEDVRVRALPEGGGVALVYELVPLHPVERIEFTGALDAEGIDTGRLRRAIVDRYGTAPPTARAADVAAFLADQLRERAFLHPSVSVHVERQHTPHSAALVFTIEPGVRTLVGEIAVVGDPAEPVATFLRRVGVTSGMPFERDVLSGKLEAFRQSRRDAGYVDTTLAMAVRLTDDDRVARVTLTVNPGVRVRVLVKGDSLPANRLRELVPIAEEGSADEDLLEDSSKRIEDYFRSLGYRDAVAPYTRDQSGGELTVTFTVSRGRLYRIRDISVSGARFLSAADLQSRLHLVAGQPLSQPQLEADLSAIEAYYRAEGFAGVRARATTGPADSNSISTVGGAASVGLQIAIDEGVRTIVAALRVTGNATLSERELLGELGLQPGRPFFLTQMAIDRDAIQTKYANRGFVQASVGVNPGISADRSRADVVFTVAEGPQVFVDHVLIVGNTRTRTQTIERELQVHAGDPLGLAALLESQRRLAALGLFRRVRITQVAHGDESTRDVLVSIEEAPVTTIGYGGGIEAGQRTRRTDSQNGAAVAALEFAPRAFFEIGRRNLFDRNRSVNLFTRVSLRPKDSPFFGGEGGSRSGTGGYGFSEYRVLGTYREPRILGTPADAVLSATIEQQVRSSFDFARRAFSADVVQRFSPRFAVSGNYQIQRTRLFNEKINPADKLLVDRLFPQLVISSFSLSAADSTRDDAVDPQSGHYLSANGQIAARGIGSEVGFLKSYFTAQVFRRLPRARGTVLAASARLGMASGFPRTVIRRDENGDPLLGPDERPIADEVRDLPASERFFAGGDTTVRGFALDQLGTRETLDKDGFAIGGNALVVLNAELRIPVRGSIGLVGFFDAGNVFSRTSAIDVTELRTSAGFGIRYRSPVGPLRIDIGFKLTRHDVVPGLREKPTALHISLGQAF